MHFAQAKTRFPELNLAHCRFGYFLFLTVGLYLPLSFLRRHTIIDDFLQIAHFFVIIFLYRFKTKTILTSFCALCNIKKYKI